MCKLVNRLFLLFHWTASCLFCCNLLQVCVGIILTSSVVKGRECVFFFTVEGPKKQPWMRVCIAAAALVEILCGAAKSFVKNTLQP